MPESSANDNSGFVIPQANENAQQASNQTAQTVQSTEIPTVQEDTGSRDLTIAGGVIIVLLIAFFFIKQGYSNSLVKKRVSPGKASMAGWWLFICLASIAVAVVLTAVNPAKFLSVLIVGPLGFVALVSALLTFKSSQA